MDNKGTAGTQSTAVMPALLGGLIAAVIGGLIWGGIVIWTGSEIGFVAWGVGLLCGLGVVMMSRGNRGTSLQILAVVASVLGIMIGKYMIVHNIVTSVIAMEQGAKAAEAISMFSMEMVRFFGENFSSVLTGFDGLWVALAVFTAWSIPKASGLKTANS